jgi:hypothetical protein
MRFDWMQLLILIMQKKGFAEVTITREDFERFNQREVTLALASTTSDPDEAITVMLFDEGAKQKDERSAAELMARVINKAKANE